MPQFAVQPTPAAPVVIVEAPNAAIAKLIAAKAAREQQLLK